MNHAKEIPSVIESKGIEPRPSWLLSAFDSPQWRITDATNQEVRINFDVALPNGTKLTDPENGEILKTIRDYAVEIHIRLHGLKFPATW